jgi:signal transduction histidine kinase
MLTIRKTFLLVCSLLVVIPLAMFWAWPHSRARQAEIVGASDRHLLVARSLARALDRYHGGVTATFDFLAAQMSEQRSIAGADTVLRSIRMRHISIFENADGSMAHTLSSDGTLRRVDVAPRLLAIAKGLTADSKGQGISGVELLDDGKPALVLAKRVKSGLVVAVLDPGYFIELGNSIAFGENGHAIIVDQLGRVIAHPERAWHEQARPISELGSVETLPQGGSGIGTFTVHDTKVQMIAGYAQASGPGWGVFVAQPFAEIDARADAINASALSVFALGLAIALLMALRAGLLVATPIRRLLAATRALTQGSGDTRLALSSSRFVPQELSELERSFNSMAEAISTARAKETEARERTEAASRAKSDFVRYVAHELRSPTNAIIGFTELLASERYGPLGSAKYREHVRDIAAGGRHLLSLVNDLLDLSRIEAGQYRLLSEPMGIDELVERCQRYLRPAAAEKNIAIDAVYECDRATITVDERAMFQVLLNLTSNAVRYCNEGAAVVITSRLNADGGLTVTIADNGPGIAPADLSRVMEPFQRVESVKNRGVQGSGLGLPIVKRLVELHGGSFSLESELGKGTRAIIELPKTCVATGPKAAVSTVAA